MRTPVLDAELGENQGSGNDAMSSVLKSNKRRFPENADSLRQVRSSPAELEECLAEDIERVKPFTGSGATSRSIQKREFVEVTCEGSSSSDALI